LKIEKIKPLVCNSKISCTFAPLFKKVKIMNKITVEMSHHEYKKFLAYKKADQIVRSIRRGLNEVQEAREGKRKLKSAYELAYEL